MLEELFTFPVVMVDGDNEERKYKEKTKNESLGFEQDNDDYDIVDAEVEYPYYNIIGIEDRWLPTKDSFDKARRGRFEACLVRFTTGVFTVPWTRKKFKAELLKFAEQYKANTSEQQKVIKIKTLTEGEYEKIANE